MAESETKAATGIIPPAVYEYHMAVLEGATERLIHGSPLPSVAASLRVAHALKQLPASLREMIIADLQHKKAETVSRPGLGE